MNSHDDSAWLDELRTFNTAHGGKKTAETIDYNRAVVSQVLSGKYAGDLAQVQTPGGIREYEIIDVRYE